METKKCSKCRRELPLTEFYVNRVHPDGLQSWCKHCQKENDKLRRKKPTPIKPGGDLPPFPDHDFDGKTNREVMDIMVRCKRWLEAHGCTIHLSGEYTEVKKLKF